MKSAIERELPQARQVAFIDWHTGPVGDGDLIFLCFSPPKSVGHAQAERWWGRDALSSAHVDQLWGSKRPTRNGILFWGIENAVSANATFAGAVVEFRSARAKTNAADALRVSMLERWLRFEGGLDAPEAAGYLQEIRNDYAPDRKSFQVNVIRHARQTYAQTLEGLATWRLSDAAD